jgi:hypothetical protein
LARIHLENASAVAFMPAGVAGCELVAALPVAVPESEPPPAATVDTGMFAPPAVAAAGRPEFPPQPATRMAVVIVAAASGHARHGRIIRLVWMLSGIWSPSGAFGSADRFYAAIGFRPVSLPAPQQPS